LDRNLNSPATFFLISFNEQVRYGSSHKACSRKGIEMEGLNGKTLRVNLTSRTVTVERQSEEDYRLFLGGRGFIATTLLRELSPGVDPLGPDNRLIFSLGPIAGHALIGSARHSVGGKSPLTGCFAESEAGGFWGAELKKSGFDFIVIEGASVGPVYLWIKDGQAEIRKADHLWGRGTAQTEKLIRDELSEQKARIACIGPGGEKLVRYACVAHDVSHIAGRNGLGGVMGSKGLKAVVVKGSQRPIPHNAALLKEMSSWMGKHFKEKTRFWQCGTGSTMISYEETGNLPIRNFRGGRFPAVNRITPQYMMEQDYVVKMEGCFICPIKCKRKVRLSAPWVIDSIYGGPEYETLAALGSNCGIDNVESIIKANEICNRKGRGRSSRGGANAVPM
jgi:aldehyde:ferredoxin oxidoreductase